MSVCSRSVNLTLWNAVSYLHKIHDIYLLFYGEKSSFEIFSSCWILATAVAVLFSTHFLTALPFFFFAACDMCWCFFYINNIEFIFSQAFCGSCFMTNAPMALQIVTNSTHLKSRLQ